MLSLARFDICFVKNGGPSLLVSKSPSLLVYTIDLSLIWTSSPSACVPHRQAWQGCTMLLTSRT